MKIVAGLIGGMLLVQPAMPAVAQEILQTFAPVSGPAARIIHAAMPTFLQTNLDISAYRIEVMEMGGSYFVDFLDAAFERPKGYRGGSPNRPELSVELDKTSLRVINASFIR